MSTIKIDYDKALSSAKKLEAAAQKCQAAASQAKQRYMVRLENCWQSSSGTCVREKLQSWSLEMLALERDLNATAQKIRKTINEMKEADRRAALVAQNASKATSGNLNGPAEATSNGGGKRF